MLLVRSIRVRVLEMRKRADYKSLLLQRKCGFTEALYGIISLSPRYFSKIKGKAQYIRRNTSA